MGDPERQPLSDHAPVRRPRRGVVLSRPDRGKGILLGGVPVARSDAACARDSACDSTEPDGGSGLRFLTHKRS